MDKILNAREARSKLIKSKASDSFVIVIKANIIGPTKNTYYSKIIINIFLGIILRDLKILNYEFRSSLDGDFYILNTLALLTKTKEYLINLEDTHPLGRLVDLDLYNIDGPLSRRDLNIAARKCLVCSNDAVYCMRIKNHSLAVVEAKSVEIFNNYLKVTINEFIAKAITLEADLDPKFGLVTKKSSGSHQDMDYLLLMKAKDAITNDLGEMFFLGLNYNLDIAFKKARELGLITEQKMYAATNGVNTYKGLIFILGIALVSLGNSLKNGSDFYNNIKLIAADFESEFSKEETTFGNYAYYNFNFLGARGEAISGYLSLRKAKRYLNDLSNKSLTLTLINLIKHTEDTVLLKRSKTIEKYTYFKNKISSIKEYNKKEIEEITNECIEENISFGGSADLLITAIFIYLIEKEFFIKYE